MTAGESARDRDATEPMHATAISPPPVSVHTRVVLTWLAIFPLVTIVNAVIGLVASSWHPLLRSLMLSLIVVPLAVYVAVPSLLDLYMRFRFRASPARRGRRRSLGASE